MDLTTVTHRSYIGTLITSFAVSLIGIFFALVYSKRFTSAIKILDNETTAIAMGDFNRKITLDTKDELSNLASAINFMSSELEKSYSQLEEKISERTSELRESEGLYRTMIDLSNEHIWTIDIDGNVTFLNQLAQDALGLKPGDWQGKHYAPLVHADDLPKVRSALDKALGGENVVYEARILRKDGHALWLLISAAPLIKKGVIAGAIGFSLDISEIKQAEEEMRNKVDELERFRMATLKRELRMKELRERIKELEGRANAEAG
jgi:PAS domain S-box-containing protein